MLRDAKLPLFEKGQSEWIECDENEIPKRMIPFGEFCLYFRHSDEENLFLEMAGTKEEIVPVVKRRLPLYMLAGKLPPVVVLVKNDADEDTLKSIVNSRTISIHEVDRIGQRISPEEQK